MFCSVCMDSPKRFRRQLSSGRISTAIGNTRKSCMAGMMGEQSVGGRAEGDALRGEGGRKPQRRGSGKRARQRRSTHGRAASFDSSACAPEGVESECELTGLATIQAKNSLLDRLGRRSAVISVLKLSIRNSISGEGDHLYTSGLRRIRQQPAPPPGAQTFVIPNSTQSSISSMSMPGTRVNSISLHPTSPTLGSCEDLARFPTESLHSFSFAHQSEDLIHNRQNILKRSIEFMRDKLGWASQSPLMAATQARVEGDEEDIRSMIELLKKANIVSAEKTPLISGPNSGLAVIDGNPFEKSFASSQNISSGVMGDMESGIHGDASAPEDARSEGTSRTGTNESSSTSNTSPPSTRKASLKRTFTDATPLNLETKLYEALAQPYIASETSPAAMGMGSRPSLSKSAVHGHTSRYAPPSEAIFTTEANYPWTILAANDLACLVFGVTKAEVRKIGILEVVKEERREWLANKLNSGENSSSFPYPHSHHASPTPTVMIDNLQQNRNIGRRVKSDAFYTGSPIRDTTSTQGFRAASSARHRPNRSRGVIMCGDVVPIQKRNGKTGAASLWVKEKKGGLIWVLEEIHEDVVFIYASQEEGHKGTVARSTGSSKSIFGDEVGVEGMDISTLIPSIPKTEEGDIDFEQAAAIRQFTAVYSASMRIPCGVESIPREQGLRVFSFPHIAGIIVLSASTLTITSTNTVFSSALFGHQYSIGMPITDLIPEFDRILNFLTDEESISLVDGMVIPEHSFRKAWAMVALRDGKTDAESVFTRPSGLSARHRDGAELKVDVQMRVVVSNSKDEQVIVDDPDEPLGDTSELVYALWITYSRQLHAASLASDPKSPLNKRPVTPPKRPSPGQPSTPVDSKDDRIGNASMIYKRLETIQQSPTPPSSEDESQPVVRKHKPTASTASMAMSKRQKSIADFIILEEMGQGAYGQVKLARYKENVSDRVVLKYVTKRRILVDTWTRDRRLGTVPLEIHVLDYLRQEGLRHPNIVEMTDFFEDDVNYYIEMVPHGLPGMDLFDYIELKTNMDEDECRSIFVQVARAIHHLHTKAKVVHRDIKDENVVLDGEGNVRLIDFGSAAYIKNGPFDVFVGTIDYAAPEVLAGKSYKGKEQDVWALGVLLYTICYKENPFYNIDEIMDRELRIPFVMSEVSLDLIRLMLDRDVERRPTIEQVLSHPWFEGLPGPDEALEAESPVEASFKKQLV
ncbi:serine/threonine protein kinase [Rhizina undulata]